MNVTDPDNNQLVQINTTGPMYVSFLAGPVAHWWNNAYTLPAVGLNHPARWGWEKTTQTAYFNKPEEQGCNPADESCDPLLDSFYQMKGFFITKANSSNPGKGPNLGSASAGDQLTLTARVYNFSLVSTPALQDPPIHVRFYGQYYCSSGASTEKSCVDPSNINNVCPAVHLCGAAFQIGETAISSIPAFNSGNSPNWVTTSVNFDTTQHCNSYLVFRVLTWMQDSQGNLLGKCPDMA